MSNRWLRFVMALVALIAGSAAIYRIRQDEQQLGGQRSEARAADRAAETALAALAEHEAALGAYVAPGQGLALWTARTTMLLDSFRAAAVDLDKAASGAGSPLGDVLDLSDRLAVLDERARTHVRDGQPLLAGEVIFTEARDLTDGMRLQVLRARAAVSSALEAREARTRRSQTMIAAGAAGLLALVLLSLVPPGRAPVDSRGALDVPLEKDPSPPGAPGARDAAGHADEESARVIPPTPRAATGAAPGTPPVPSGTAPPLGAVASLCTDLARVSQSGEITALLDRAASVLDASGLMVWMSSEDGRELIPAASAGYDERVFARIGAVPRDASNITAAAFREGAARTQPRQGASAPALAVPLLTPASVAGVFSAELRSGQDVDADHLAVATIFAAQLAMLLGSMSTERVPPASRAEA